MQINTISFINLWLSGMKALVAVLATMSFVVATTEIAEAQSCQSVLQGHGDWASSKSQGAGEYWLRFVLVSNVLTQKATYAEGSLELKHAILTGDPGFRGTATQYFNDRRWNFPQGSGFEPEKHPFDPLETADLNVWLNAATGKATIGSYTFDLKCDHPGVLFGAGNPQGPFNIYTPMFVISLKRNFIAAPK